MQKEKVTRNQAMFSIILFNFGSSVVIGISTDVSQDAWIAIMVATLLALPIFLLYSRILQLFPEKNLFQIAELLFGGVGGKIISVLYVWYGLHLAALVLRNFSEFTQVSTMPETPQLPILILMALTAVYLARSGMAAMGKWSVIGTGFVLFVVFFTFFGSIYQMEPGILLPVMSSTPKKLVLATLQVFSFPYAEAVLFLCLGDTMGRDATSYKIFVRAILITLVIFLMVFLRNITLLGGPLMDITYFPSYVTARIIKVGGFLERIEGSISTNFLVAGILKISVCLLAVSKGFASLIGKRDGRALVIPTGLLALALSAILYHNPMEMFAFTSISFAYKFPFQVLIPILLWIAGELHVRRGEKREQETGGYSY